MECQMVKNSLIIVSHMLTIMYLVIIVSIYDTINKWVFEHLALHNEVQRKCF